MPDPNAPTPATANTDPAPPPAPTITTTPTLPELAQAVEDAESIRFAAREKVDLASSVVAKAQADLSAAQASEASAHATALGAINALIEAAKSADGPPATVPGGP